MKKFIFAGAIALMMTVASCGTKDAETNEATDKDSTTVGVDTATGTDSVTNVDTVVVDGVPADSVAE